MMPQVPSLEMDGLVLTQSVAIMEYIADRWDPLEARLKCPSPGTPRQASYPGTWRLGPGCARWARGSKVSLKPS